MKDLWSLPLPELIARARTCTDQWQGKKVFLRGLIEVTNYCVQNCLYCGIRRDNQKVMRYRMDEEQILSLVREGFQRRFRTFVLQGGEDPEFPPIRLARLCKKIYSLTRGEAAITFGNLPRSGYRLISLEGANRYLLRFETSDPILHKRLRNGIPLSRRLQALEDIRWAGLEVGSGFMVGLPGETEEIRIGNVLLAKELDIDMGGVGPFIPHPDTPLGDSPQVDLEPAIRSTTAAGSLDSRGRERMLEAGANVLMPNLTPQPLKKAYSLYPGKSSEEKLDYYGISSLSQRVAEIGLELSWERGDAFRKRLPATKEGNNGSKC